MLSTQNPSTLGATLDPNLGRVIEETIGVVNDVETRLQALKIGISQALPQLAPALLWREAALASLANRQSPYASLYGNVPTPYSPFATGIPSNVPTAFSMFPTAIPSIPQAFAGLSSLPMTPNLGAHLALNPQPIPPGVVGATPSLFTSPFGVHAGVSNPFGIVTPFRFY